MISGKGIVIRKMSSWFCDEQQRTFFTLASERKRRKKTQQLSGSQVGLLPWLNILTVLPGEEANLLHIKRA